MLDLNKNSSGLSLSVLTYRFLLVVGSVAITVFGLLHLRVNPNFVEPMYDRLILSAMGISVFLFSFLDSLKKKYLINAVHILLFLYIIVAILSLYRNDFGLLYIVDLIIAIEGTLIIINRNRLQYIFLGFIVFSTTPALFLNDNLSIGEKLFKFTLIALSCFISGIIGRLISKSNARIQLNESFLKGILNQTVDAFLILNRKGIIEITNSMALKLLEAESDKDIINKHVNDFFKEIIPIDERKKIQEHVDNGKIWRKELICKSVIGNEFWGDIAIWSQKNQMFNYSIIRITNIDKIKKAEKRLQRGKELAEALAKNKADFLATMSHEIRTPMNAIIGMNDLLLETSLDTEQQEYVETIKLSGENLLNLINDILDFSKIESGKMELERQPIKVEQIIEDVLNLLSLKATEKQVELFYDIESDVPAYVIGDPVRIKQVLMNLTGNAIKFTHQGEVVIKVERNKEQENEEFMMQFSIKDTGIGIDSEKKGKLFQSFSQVDTSTTRKYGGSGLGLVICKKLVNLMKGDIWFESELHKGSIFHFNILTKKFNKLRPYKRDRGFNLVDKRILLTMKNINLKKILHGKLLELSAKPLLAFNKDEFEKIIKSYDVDVAIIDTDINTADLEIINRNLDSLKSSFPVIFLTTHGKRIKDNMKEPVRTLRKPVIYSKLIDELNQLFSKDEIKEYPPVKETPPSNFTNFDKNITILLAEDNIINQKVALKVLDKIGLSADIANNGKEVIDAVKEKNYDLILMDLQMPEMDGIEASRLIRAQNGSFAQPIIIAMTANVLDNAKNLCMEAGMNDYIGKPFQIDQLKKLFEKWFNGKSGKIRAQG